MTLTFTRTASSQRGVGQHSWSALLAAVLGCAMILLTGCAEDELILKGERISVLPERSIVTSDPDAFAEGAGLPPLVNMMNASSVGLNSGHAGGHLQFEGALKRVWSARIGGQGSEIVELAPPVVFEGQVFTVAPNGVVKAFDVVTGAENWSVRIEEIDDDPLPGVGGGIAVSAAGVVVHAGGRNLSLLDAVTGDEKWTVRIDLPLRGGPTLMEDTGVVVTDLDSNLIVFRLDNSEIVWDRVGLASDTVMFGSPAPAFANGELVLVGAHGEVTYFSAVDGELLWTDSVAVFNPRTPIEGIGDVRAHPVHDGGMLFVISQSGRIAAFNARSGLLVWDQPIGGIEMPWLAGETLFVVGLDGRLYALRRLDGAVRWVAELPGAVAADVVVAEDPPRYVGPIVAGGKVMVISKSGQLHVFNPDTGVEIEKKSLGMTVLTSPQVAAGRLFVMGNGGTLNAYE